MLQPSCVHRTTFERIGQRASPFAPQRAFGVSPCGLTRKPTCYGVPLGKTY